MDGIIPAPAQRLLIPVLDKPNRLRIGPGPKLLLQKLRRLPSWSKLGFAFPSQELLAAELGASIKTIRRWTKKLVDAGLLSTTEDGEDRRRLLYFPGPENGPTAQPETVKIRGQAVPHSVPQLGDKVSPILIPDELRNLTTATSAAAVEPKAKEKTEETVKQFSAVGVDAEAIRPHVHKDPAQAAVVLAILRGRRFKPPGNPTGFAIRAFENRWTGPEPPRSIDPKPQMSWHEKFLKLQEQAALPKERSTSECQV